MRWFLAVLAVAGPGCCQLHFTINTVVGNGTPGYSGDGGPAINAELNGPTGVATDAFGNLYIADYYNNVVRKVTPDGKIITLAGNGTAGYSGDGGTATTATMNLPFRLNWDPLTGNIYVAEVGNNVVRVIKPDGKIATFAGTGIQGYAGDGGFATSARLYQPTGVATDGLGNVFIVDAGNAVIREVNILGYISTVAGNSNQFGGFSGDGGPAMNAALRNPEGIAFGPNRSFYFADQGNDRIRYVDTKGIIHTVAGNGTMGYSGDGGPATAAELRSPAGPTLFPLESATGNLYFADVQNSVIRVLTGGTIATVAGNGTAGFSGDGGSAASSELSTPRTVCGSRNGNLYVADFGNNRIRLLTRVLPPPAISAVVNGASFVGGGMVPGEIATAFGSNLTSTSGINVTSSLPLPTTFETDSLMVNNQPVALFAVDNVNGQQQINFQVPWEIASGANATIAASNNGTSGASISVPVLAAQPGIFNYSAGGQTFGAILHANFQLADTAHPAKPGETVLIYCTGLGAVESPPPDGAASNGQATIVVPTVTMGGTEAIVSFSGLAPGFVGLYQINAKVPAGLTAGNQPVAIEVTGVSSNSVLLPIS